jgi:CxxC motif-containing protein
MVSTEKIFDMLPSVVILYDKLDIDGYRKRIAEENKGKENISNELLGINLFKYILQNSVKVKEDVFEIVSIFEDKPIEEVKAQSFMKTFNTLKEICSDTETTDFLQLAMQSDTPEA